MIRTDQERQCTRCRVLWDPGNGSIEITKVAEPRSACEFHDPRMGESRALDRECSRGDLCGKHTVRPQPDRLGRGVVGCHRDDGLCPRAGIARRGTDASASALEGSCFSAGAVENTQVMAGMQ